jgi:hypothetical protein
MSDQEVVMKDCICDDAGSTECNGTDKPCKKKKKLSALEIAKLKMKREMEKNKRKRAKRYTQKLDRQYLTDLFGPQAWLLEHRFRTFEWERLIFNLLVKACRNDTPRSGDEKLRIKYALTREAKELANMISIEIISKYEFRILDYENIKHSRVFCLIRFKELLSEQYNRVVSETHRGRFILEKEGL